MTHNFKQGDMVLYHTREMFRLRQPPRRAVVSRTTDSRVEIEWPNPNIWPLQLADGVWCWSEWAWVSPTSLEKAQ